MNIQNFLVLFLIFAQVFHTLASADSFEDTYRGSSYPVDPVTVSYLVAGFTEESLSIEVFSVPGKEGDVIKMVNLLLEDGYSREEIDEFMKFLINRPTHLNFFIKSDEITKRIGSSIVFIPMSGGMDRFLIPLAGTRWIFVVEEGDGGIEEGSFADSEKVKLKSSKIFKEDNLLSLYVFDKSFLNVYEPTLGDAEPHFGNPRYSDELINDLKKIAEALQDQAPSSISEIVIGDLHNSLKDATAVAVAKELFGELWKPYIETELENVPLEPNSEKLAQKSLDNKRVNSVESDVTKKSDTDQLQQPVNQETEPGSPILIFLILGLLIIIVIAYYIIRSRDK